MTDGNEKLKSTLKKIVKRTIEEQFAEQNIELIDMEIKGNRSKRLLRIFIDKKDGITLEDCANFSKGLSVMLDVANSIEAGYTLEVSSPGGRKKQIL